MLGAVLLVVAGARAAAKALGLLPPETNDGELAMAGRIRLAVMSDLDELRRLERELVRVEVRWHVVRSRNPSRAGRCTGLWSNVSLINLSNHFFGEPSSRK